MKTPIAAVKSSGAEPPAAMKVAPATSSLIPPVTKRGYFTPKQKNSGSHESRVSYVLEDSTNKKM